MTPKQYLMQAVVLKQMIDRTELKITEIRSKMQGLGSMRYDKLNVQSSPEDRMATYIDQIIDVERRELVLLNAYYTTYAQIRSQIDGMNNLLYQQVLGYRYLDGLSLVETANKMNYSYDYVRELHGRALQEFGKRYNVS